MSSLELIRLSKLFSNLEQHPAIPRLKRLSFYNPLDSRPMNEKVTLALKGFACNSLNSLTHPLGSPREDIVHKLLQMCSILFVIYGKIPDPLESIHLPDEDMSVFIMFDENLISIAPIEDLKYHKVATKDDRADVSFVEFEHLYDINVQIPQKNNFRTWDVPVHEDDEFNSESAKVFTLDPRVDDAFVQRFITEFYLSKVYFPYLVA